MDPRLQQWMSYRPSFDRVRPSYPRRSPYASPNTGNTPRRISYPVSSPQQQPAQGQQPRRGCCGGRR